MQTLYIITPPNSNIELDELNRILLTTPDKNSIQPKPSINIFFVSLAKMKKEHAIGIILSGTGTDGTQGMRAIKAEGGITIVQDPESAKYDSMPKSAIDDSNVDIVINPSKMGDELVALANFPKERVLDKYKVSAPISELSVIYNALYNETKIDFSVYKKNTLIRRIERRMFARKTSTLSEYTSLINNDRDEVISLFKDILIGVTSFFRDKDSFEALMESLKNYISDHQDLKEMRVWVAGTSTGEEAYSVLFAIHETLNVLNKKISIKVFATDVDETALKTARRSLYSVSSLAEVSRERIDKYFTASEEGYEVKKEYREQVLFSVHNLLGDPPFKDIDLITCRNLLIYFDLDAQSYVMPMIHYALNDNGLLFLGKSENIASYDHLFATIDSRHKVFKRVKSARKVSSLQGSKKPKYSLPQSSNKNPPTTDKKSPIHEAIIDEAAKIILPNTVVVNEQMEIVYKKGDLSFITVPEGYVTYNIYKMVDSKIALDLRTLINSIKDTQEAVSSALIPINNSSEINFLKVYVTKLSNRHNPLYVFYFMEISKVDIPLEIQEKISTDSFHDKFLEVELKRAKTHMQALVEELETANEELQSTNEELQSSNEELQSTNEEMETSNEELQSTNEELQTAYAELKEIYNTKNTIQEKNMLLLNQYQMLLENVKDSITISTIQGLFVDANQAMVRLTGYTKDQLLLKSWEDLAVTPNNKSLKELYKSLIQNNKYKPFELEIITKDNKIKTIIINCYLIDNKKDPVKIWNFATDITEKKLAQQKLDKINKQYEATFSDASVGICNIGLNDKITDANTEICNILGYSKDQLIGKTLNSFTYIEDINKDKKEFDQLTSVKIDRYKVEKRFIFKNKKTLWVSVSISCVKDINNNPCYYIAIIENINTIKLLSFEKNMAQMIMNTTQELVIVTDVDRIIEYVNPAFEKKIGYTKEELIGKHNSILKSGENSEAFYRHMKKSLKNSGKWSGEVINRKKNGDLINLLLNIDRVKNDSDEIIKYIGIYSDMSTIRQKDNQIEFLANHDALTKLPNKNAFEQKIDIALYNASTDANKLAFYFIDLDRFKIVNDGLGHNIGDLVLIKVAKRLNNCARKGDSISRIGGDEFAIFTENLKDHASAGYFADRIISEISKPMYINGHNIEIGASVGISIFPDDGNQPNELMKSADIAMYEAKNAGRGTFKYASPQLSNDAFEKATVEHAIAHGITNKEFRVYYQPIICIETNRVSHFEALIRWKHPTMGLIMPNRFIPIAEESSIIEDITLYVANQVIDDIVVLQNKLDSNVAVSINFSVRDFESDSLLDFIKDRLHQNKITPDSLIIEMTERKIISDRFTDSNWSKGYNNLGCKIAIDDFGTGYSNLSSLNKMKIDFLKIDKSFIDNIGNNSQNEEIIRATIAIAKALKYKTIAEGVETKKQYDFLAKNGCDYIQGYYICEPKPLEKTILFLDNRKD